MSINTAFCQITNVECPPEQQAGCGDWQVLAMDINMSKYAPLASTDCYVGVAIAYRICNGQIQIGDWAFQSAFLDESPTQFNSDECHDYFYDHLYSYYSPGNSDTDGFARFWKDFSILVGQQGLERLVADQLNSLPNIPSNLGCFGGKPTVSAEFYQGSCQSICVGVKKGKKKGKDVVIRKGTCGTQCCKMTTYYCVDETSTPGNVTLHVLGTKFESDGSDDACQNPSTPGGIDYECERGITGETHVEWLYNITCTPMCTEDVKKVVLNNYPSTYIKKGIGLQSLNVKIYPNPASEILGITFNAAFEGEVSLFNIEGKKIESREINKKHDIEFNVSNLLSGMYFVHFKDKMGNLITEKINITQK